MHFPFSITEERQFSAIEKQMIWRKPPSHQTSEEELRIATEIKENWDDSEMKIMNVLLEGDAGSGKTQLAKALSSDLQLPYTKITCFADMDKSDVFGALLPIVASDSEEDQELLAAIYQTESLQAVLRLISQHYGIDEFMAKQRLVDFVNRAEAAETTVQYRYYPSEIVRAIEKGYLLEIQEPTVIRDASVLVALNSAMEPNGMLNLPTGIVQRHPDCIIIITTNRNYQGNRPLNESLRDRVQHAEKMDLPSIEVMVERGMTKTGVSEVAILTKMAEIIRLLDEVAKSNAIKGVAGMRSYFYWINTYKHQQNLLQSIYPKVLYKITTDENELKLLIEALDDSKLLFELQGLVNKNAGDRNRGRKISKEEAKERNITQDSEEATLVGETTTNPATTEETQDVGEDLRKQTNSSKEEKLEAEALDLAGEKSAAVEDRSMSDELSEDEAIGYGESDLAAYNEQQKKEKKQLNQEAREFLRQTVHNKSGLIIHRPEVSQALIQQAALEKRKIGTTVDELVKKMRAILDNEESTTYQTGKYEGTRFNASRVAFGDFRNFDRQNPPDDAPSLALALRIDESGSMVRDDRIKNAQLAALAVTDFAKALKIPLMIYGDTADISMREKTSIYSYKEFQDDYQFVDAKLMAMKPRQNNRDGVVLRLMADKLLNQTATTKLLINISDGQPKALPDYSGKMAKEDIQQVLNDYERQGIIFLAAAIGQDREVIKNIYGESRFINISDLKTLPYQLVELISRYV